MATPRNRPNKSGKPSWEISIRRAGHPPISASFPTKKEAEEFAKEAEERIAQERRAISDPHTTLPVTGKLEDEQLMTTMKMFIKSDACIKRHRQMMPTVLRNIGSATIGQLKPSWVTGYVARMRKQLTPRNTNYAYETIVSHLHMINVVLKWRAESLDLATPKFSIDTTKFPSGWEKKRTRRFEPGEESILMARLSKINGPSKHHWMLLVRLAIETGARLQELIYAEWKEISPGFVFWTIPASHTKCKKERVMPLTSGAVEALTELAAIADPSSKRLFHTMKNPTTVSALFHRWVLSAGLVDFRFHDLRHEGISRFVLTQRGFSVYEILQMVGHSSTEMLQRYSNLRGDELAKKLTMVNQPSRPANTASPISASWDIKSFGIDFSSIKGHHPVLKTSVPSFDTTTLLKDGMPNAAHPQHPAVGL